MRARMTAYFLVVLSPLLLTTCMVLPRLVAGKAEVGFKQRFGEALEQAEKLMAGQEWGPELQADLEKLCTVTGDLAAQVVNGRGEVLWRSSGKRLVWPPAEKRERQNAASKIAGKLTRKPVAHVSRDTDPWWFMKLPAGEHTLILALSRRGVIEEQQRQKLSLLGLSLLVILAVGFGTWLLVGRTLSPIGRLARQAEVASVERLHVHLKAPSRDAEVVGLVDTLNGLLARISEAAAVRGRFYAAASHELRTPLQALSGHLEVALSRERTAEEYESFLQEAHRQAGRLSSLVQDLLLLHQLDSAPPRPQVPVDLAAVCASVLQQMAPLVEARSLRLQVDLAPETVLLAVPTHAEILARNLVENAVKYASVGGRVTVTLTVPGNGPRLEVFNECAAPPEGDPENLFEPLYRPDTARSGRTGGNGLGLAICRAVAVANGWWVTLAREPGGMRAAARFSSPPPAV